MKNLTCILFFAIHITVFAQSRSNFGMSENGLIITMINATFMEIVNKKNIFTLILMVFMLTENCFAEKPIANYCLDTKSIDEYFFKLESIIDSSVFAKMEDTERNCWVCSSEEENRKNYLLTIKHRYNMTCYHTEEIYKEYSFLFKNMNVSATNRFDSDIMRGTSGGIGVSINCCMDPSTRRIGDCPKKIYSSSSIVISLSSSSKNYSPIEATTELIIDFPEYNSERIKDSSVFNEIKSSFGDTIPVSWEFKIRCPPHNDTTITGSYFVRINGECSK